MECYVANNSFRSILNYSGKHPYYIVCQVISQVMRRNIQNYPYFVRIKRYTHWREIYININIDYLWRVILWVTVIFLLYNFSCSKISTVNIDYIYKIKSLTNEVSFDNSSFETRLLDFPTKQVPFPGFPPSWCHQSKLQGLAP